MTFGLRRVHAFSLVELTLTLGIAAFCLIAVLGLMPVGVQTNRNATSQTAAANITAAVIADVRATPKATTTSAQFGINIPTDPTTGVDPTTCQRCASCWNSETQTLYLDTAGQVTTAGNGRYRVTFTHVKNSTAIATAGAVFADLNVTWPAPADPCATTPSGSVEAMAAFDRN
jgi:type II secretory pathway pseudopilin PulG